MVTGLLELGLRAPQSCLRSHPLCLQTGNLRVGGDRVGLPPPDVGRRGVELRGRLRDARGGRRHTVSQPLDLLPRQRERGLRPRERNLVGTRVDQEEEIPLLDLLIVPDVKLDDVSIDLGCDAHEVGADRGIVRLRPRLPLQQRHDHGDDGSADNARPDQSTKEPAATLA